MRVIHYNLIYNMELSRNYESVIISEGRFRILTTIVDLHWIFGRYSDIWFQCALHAFDTMQSDKHFLEPHATELHKNMINFKAETRSKERGHVFRRKWLELDQKKHVGEQKAK